MNCLNFYYVFEMSYGRLNMKFIFNFFFLLEFEIILVGIC